MSTKTAISKEVVVYYLSVDRVDSYLQLAGEDFDKAIELYTENKEKSKYLHSLLVELEVVLRNAINHILVTEIGESWTSSEHLKPQQKEVINAVIQFLKLQNKPINNSNIISNLHFGFWVYFFNAVYDRSFWRQYLYKIFTNPPSALSRGVVRLELEKFKKLRNRIAHCENILKYPHKRYAEEIFEFINWINPQISAWVREISKA